MPFFSFHLIAIPVTAEGVERRSSLAAKGYAWQCRFAILGYGGELIFVQGRKATILLVEQCDGATLGLEKNTCQAFSFLLCLGRQMKVKHPAMVMSQGLRKKKVEAQIFAGSLKSYVIVARRYRKLVR